jgi:hypothetical protein
VFLLKRDEATELQQALDRSENDASRIIADKYRQHVLDAIQKAWTALGQNDVRQARRHLYEAQHHFDLARYNNQVIFYHSWHAFAISIVYFLLFCGIAASAIWVVPIRQSALALSVFIAFAGGGIGGVAAVLSKAVGIHLETQAITTRITWYTIKPTLGAIMGLATYLAVLSGLSLLAGPFQVSNLPGAFLTGFLGGYLESFSTRLLDGIADRMVGSKQPNGSDADTPPCDKDCPSESDSRSP